jgi:hypothetical protein
LFAIAAVMGEAGIRCTQNSLGMVEICLSRFSGSLYRRQNTERSMFKSLAGRTAVVTGASKGIGWNRAPFGGSWLFCSGSRP